MAIDGSPAEAWSTQGPDARDIRDKNITGKRGVGTYDVNNPDHNPSLKAALEKDAQVNGQINASGTPQAEVASEQPLTDRLDPKSTEARIDETTKTINQLRDSMSAEVPDPAPSADTVTATSEAPAQKGWRGVINKFAKRLSN